jgi:hypothetical protein
MLGAAHPDLDTDMSHYKRPGGAYFLFGKGGALYGNGLHHHAAQLPDGEGLAAGDRVGFQLDLDAGTLRVYRNGRRFGPGFEGGVRGPLAFAVQLYDTRDAVEVIRDVS